MSEFSTNPSQGRTESETNVGRFLAQRGLLFMRESKEIGVVRGEGQEIQIETLILTCAKSSEQAGEVNYGLSLKVTDSSGDARAAFVDFDELDELLSAFTYIEQVAKKMAGEKRDETEIAYLTKDNIQFGIHHNKYDQKGFIRVSGHGSYGFLSIERLQDFKSYIRSAMNHLKSKGAS
jgi:hypothetical protein